MVRFVGSDKQGVGSSAVRAPELQLQTLQGSTPLMQSANQQAQQLGESMKAGYQFQAQTAARMSEDFNRTSSTLAESTTRSIESGRGDGGLGQALSNLAKVGNMVSDTLESRAKREALLREQEQKNYEAQMKATRERNASVMWERLSKWETDAPTVARLNPGGTVTLRNQLADMFNTTEGQDLTAEDRDALMKHGYGNVIAGLVSKNVEQYMGEQKKLQETVINTRKEQALLSAGSLITSLGAASTSDEQNAAFSKLTEFIAKVQTSNEFDPQTKAEISFALTEATRKGFFTSEENRHKAQEVFDNLTRFQQDVNKARELHPNDPDAQEAYIANSAFLNKIPDNVVGFYTQSGAEGRALQRIGNKEKFDEYRRLEISRTLGATGTDFEAGYDAQFYGDDLTRLAEELGGGDAKLGATTPRYQQVLAAKNALKEWRESVPKMNIDLAQLSQKKLELGKASNAQVLAAVKALKPGDAENTARYMTIFNAVAKASNNPQLQAWAQQIPAYQQMDANARAQWEQMFNQAVQNGLDINTAISSAIDAEAAAIRQKKQVLDLRIAQYGFDPVSDGAYPTDRAKEVESRRQQQEAARQAAYAAQQAEMQQGQAGGTATPAPFSRGSYNGIQQLTPANSPSGTLILPVPKTVMAKQAPANIGDGVGWRTPTRPHHGQDVGVDIKTPIVAHMDGIVRKVSYQDRGAGHFIEVEYPDGSSHVFMHLYQQPNLVVGQRIKGGQVIGLVGNTGMPGGNTNPGNAHIHWEVYYGDQRSTPQIWSAKYQEYMAKNPPSTQQRAPGPGSSITAPVRGAQGVPVKGGILVPDGKGGARRQAYNSPSVTPQSLKQAGIIPTPVRVDKTKAGQVLLQRTGSRDPNTGLEHIVATAYDRNGNVAGEYILHSGRKHTQQYFGTAKQDVPNIESPASFGEYSIGDLSTWIDASSVRAFGGMFIPVTPIDPNNKRTGVGLHFDGDQDVAPGSAGCMSFQNKAEFQQFMRILKDNDIRKLNFVRGLRDSGQQKQRPPYPSKSEIQVGGGQVLYGAGGQAYQRIGGKLVPVQPYTPANPVRNLKNSNRSADYNRNDITNNHGFKALKDDPRKARAVNEVARDLGVPGEWLAEVMSVETDNTFSTQIREYGGSGAVGLIQFYPDHDGGSTKTINGKVYNLSDIGRMTFDQQVRGPVMDYIKEAMRANGLKRINTIQDLYALVYAYTTADKARGMPDSHGNSGSSILNRLGKFSGRKYSYAPGETPTFMPVADAYESDRANKLQRRIDRNYHASCVTCQQMASLGMFTAHERVNLNRGMDTFTLSRTV